MNLRNETTNSTTDEQLQLVSFVVSGELFAVDVLCVQEINRMMSLTRIPQPPEGVEGIIYLRGAIIPVLHLGKQFGMPCADQSEQTRIIVMDIQGKTVGLIVDAVQEVVRIAQSQLAPPPQLNTTLDENYVTGVAELDDRLLIILDLDKLISPESINDIDQCRNAA
jgi:purine-binding chemotaxis protein CheW